MFNRKKIKKLEKEVRDLKWKIERRQELYEKNKKLKADNFSLRSENTALQTKVRIQTEADLYFECEKIQKKLLDGEKRENLTEQIAYREMLQQQLALQEQQPQTNYGGLLTALGRGLF